MSTDSDNVIMPHTTNGSGGQVCSKTVGRPAYLTINIPEEAKDDGDWNNIERGLQKYFYTQCSNIGTN